MGLLVLQVVFVKVWLEVARFQGAIAVGPSKFLGGLLGAIAVGPSKFLGGLFTFMPFIIIQ